MAVASGDREGRSHMSGAVRIMVRSGAAFMC